jgi:SlyX protein
MTKPETKPESKPVAKAAKPTRTEAQVTDERLTNLEIKASFTEDLVDSLNQVIVRQQQDIDLLLRQLAQLREQMAGADAGAPRNLRDELPPHY